MAQAKGAPICLSIDDTVIEKKKQSSRAMRLMEGTGWHCSHLEGKQVFGYQVFGTNISTCDFSLCYCLRRCCPENGSKIDMAVQLLDTLPETDARIILQVDNWYTCKALWDKVLETLIKYARSTGKKHRKRMPYKKPFSLLLVTLKLSGKVQILSDG